LEDCGFIKVTKPTGIEKLEHKPTKIEIFDPPRKLPGNIISKYCDNSYSTFCEWFVETTSKTNLPKIPNDTFENPTQTIPEFQNRHSQTPKQEFPETHNKKSNLRRLNIPRPQKKPSDGPEWACDNNKDNIAKYTSNKNNYNKEIKMLMKVKYNSLFRGVSRETLKKLLKSYSSYEIKRTIEILTSNYQNGNSHIKSPTALLISCLKDGVFKNFSCMDEEKGDYIRDVNQERLSLNSFNFNQKIELFIEKCQENNNGNFEYIWEFILARLKESLNLRTYELWIKPLKFITIKEGRIIALTPNRFSAKWLRGSYQDKFREIFRKYGLNYTGILFIPATKE